MGDTMETTCEATEGGGLRCTARYLRLHGPIEDVREKRNGELEVAGWPSRPNLDDYDTIFEPEAWRRTLGDYMNYGALLFNHDPNRLLGRTNDLEIVPGEGLRMNRATISAEPNPPQARTWIREGILNKFSVGFWVMDGGAEAIQVKAPRAPEGVSQRLRFTNLKLNEISMVTVPGNVEADAVPLSRALEAGTDLQVGESDPAALEWLTVEMARVLGARGSDDLEEGARRALYNLLAPSFYLLGYAPPDLKPYTRNEWEQYERSLDLEPAGQRVKAKTLDEVIEESRKQETETEETETLEAAALKAVKAALEVGDEEDSVEKLLAEYTNRKTRTQADYQDETVSRPQGGSAGYPAEEFRRALKGI